MAKKSRKKKTSQGSTALRRRIGANPRVSHDSRDVLLREAKQVFAAKGFEGATVKDLATAAGLNISLVSYHFGGKEGLYRTCLESFGMERVEATERILRAPSSCEDFKVRLRLFAEDFIEIHFKDPSTCKMINRGVDNLDPITAEVFQNVFLRVFDAFYNFIEAAKDAGFLRADVETEVSTALAVGGLMHLLRMQDLLRLLGKPTLEDPSYREQVIENWVENTTSGIFADRSQKR